MSASCRPLVARALALSVPPGGAQRLRIRTGFASFNPGGADVMRAICSRRATARDLGFSIRSDLATGLAETLSWTQGNRPHPIPETENATPPLARQENIT